MAYTNIPAEATIYPIVSSTSAKSAVKLINATSVRESLQFHCMKVLARDPKMVQVKPYLLIAFNYDYITPRIF